MNIDHAAPQEPIPAEEAAHLLALVEASHRLEGPERELTEDERELILRELRGEITEQEFLDETRRLAQAVQDHRAGTTAR